MLLVVEDVFDGVQRQKDVNKEMKDMTKEEMMNDPRFKSTIEIIEKMVKGGKPDEEKDGVKIFKI